MVAFNLINSTNYKMKQSCGCINPYMRVMINTTNSQAHADDIVMKKKLVRG